MTKLYDLVRFNTPTLGTGAISIGGAVSGFLTPSQAGAADQDLVSYAIRDGTNSETGTGTYSSGPQTITRTVRASTNSNNPISLSGSAEVVITPNALDFPSVGALEFLVSGAGLPITTGLQGFIESPFAGQINSVALLADQSGTIVIDVFKCTYAQFDGGVTHPVSADKITGSNPPTITATTKYQDTTLTGWTKSVNAGDIFGFNVNSTSGAITRVTISMRVTMPH